MDFFIKQNEDYYGEILFNQIMDFDKTFIKNTPENFEKYFLTLKEKYPFGEELYFLIKNCQNDPSLNNLSELSSFVCDNLTKFKKTPSVYKERKDQNNLNYSPDCDFFFPFFSSLINLDSVLNYLYFHFDF